MLFAEITQHAEPVSDAVSNLPLWVSFLQKEIFPDWHAIIKCIVTILVGLTVIRQRRRHSVIYAWIFLVLITPIFGGAIFLLFGMRKHRRTISTKQEINKLAGVITNNETPNGAKKTSDGNSFELLDNADGTATWNALCKEISTAKKSIYITTYILEKNKVGRELIARLAARAREGVEVKLLIDTIGSWGVKQLIGKPLLKAGGQIQYFMPLFSYTGRGSANFRNHRKIAIFDGQCVITGGQNLANKYTGPVPFEKRYRDFSARISGPAVSEFTRIFLSDWCFTRDESPELYNQQLTFQPAQNGTVRLEIVSTGPDEPNDPLWERFLTLFQESRNEITIVTPYLVPDEVLFRLLIAKIRGNKKVRLILPKKSDHPFLDFARQPYMRALQQAGAEVLLFNKGMMHGKLFLTGSTIGVVGSANLDMRSLFVNFEVVTFVHSPNSVRRLRLLAEDLVKNCIPYNGSEWHRRTLKNRAIEALAHMLGPQL